MRKSIGTLCLLVTLALAGCGGGDNKNSWTDEPVTPGGTEEPGGDSGETDPGDIAGLTPVSLNPYGCQGGSQELSFTCNADWAVAAPEWLTASPEAGAAGTVSVTLTAGPNLSPQQRTGTVVISCKDASRRLSVSQAGTSFSVTCSSSTIGHEGGEISLTVTSSLDYQLRTLEAEWLRLKSHDPDRGVYLLTVDANPDPDDRSTTLVVEQPATGAVAEVSIQQSGRPTLTVDRTDYEIDYQLTSLTLTVQSNRSDFRVASSETWLEMKGVSGSGPYTVSLRAQLNTTPDPRTARVTLSLDGAPEVVVTVKQASKPTDCGTIDDMPVEDL